MPERDVVSWNTIIGALVDESSFLDAIELFCSMQNQGIALDEVTMVSVVSACGYLGALRAMVMEADGERALELFHEMVERGIAPDEELCGGRNAGVQ